MDHEMIKYLAELGKLEFSEKELDKASKDMTDIIDLMDKVKEIDIVYDAEADNHNVYLNDLREDAEAESMPTKKVIQNAKNSGGCFVVPKVVE